MSSPVARPLDLRITSISAAIFAYALVVFGAVVRINNAGMTCPDWPRCRGVWFPALTDSVVYEWDHRVGATVLTLLIVATVALAWRWRRVCAPAYRASWVALAMLFVQILVGALTIRYANSPASVAAHLVVGVTTFISLALVAALAYVRADAAAPVRFTASAFGHAALACSLLAFVTVFAGGYMSASQAGWACTGLPLCNGWIDAHTPLQQLHMAHRYPAYATLVATTLLFVLALGSRLQATVIRLAGAALFLALLQGALGFATVASGLAPVLRSVHQANGVLLTAALALLAFASYTREAAGVTAPDAAGAISVGGPTKFAVVKAYFSLMKFNVMSLLLFTTLTSMMIAARGFPPLPLVLWTLLGGALAVGASGALNHYLDRDIDGRMRRTNRRPIPSGVVSPPGALLFGGALSVAAYAVLALAVNFLAAILAVTGILYYVFIYTFWLKRRTPQNIVIGGAAGAIPPLVGWAAVTGDLGLTALMLFLIVFVWTPPHFWALALIAKEEYAGAGVPMLPGIAGDAATKRQILIYTAALALTTLALVPLRLMGWTYLAAVLVLDAMFFVFAVRVAREDSVASQRVLYRYSMLYLALLFCAMVADRFTIHAL